METADNKDPESAGEKKPPASKGKDESLVKATGLKGTRSLRRLRDRVERAASELIRLREENATLQERIEELEGSGAAKADGGAGKLVLDTDPEALKRKVEGFIQSIDNYLDNKEISSE